ncbi:MAG: proteasome accessory factor PafA2 [Actinomycetales bacterium]|nr:MAG: proteasome accessory factor PafA2 [Actinomycetales bacterium]
MGIETEYGISAPGEPNANPIVLSGQVIMAYARAHGLLTGQGAWDYATEAPLRDARGWELDRGLADPTQLTDLDDPTMANVVLMNGARYYVDHAHPEYSGPEVTTPRDALIWDQAGDRVMREATELLSPDPARPAIALYKNNTDGKGASYGTHENYLMRRETAFHQIIRGLTPFFVARQVICGAGRVGIGPESQTPGFQISQRADFFETEVGLETTFKRPIINTRDEPHAATERYRRLHVIIGDANQCDVAGLLKTGTTSLVLACIEDRTLPSDIAVADPVGELHQVSHDPTLHHLITLRDGRRLTALELLWTYHDAVAAYLHSRGHRGADESGDPDTAEVMRLWADVLTRLGADPSSCARDLDWVAKLRVLQAYRDRDGLGWTDPRLAALDIQWSELNPAKSVFAKLRAAGRVTRLVSESQVLAAVSGPPEDTRAWFRGQCLSRYADAVVSASWDSVIFDVPGTRSLQRVPMLEPLRGTRAQLESVLDASPDVATLLERLGDTG